MKKERTKKKSRIFMEMLTSPVFICMYLAFWILLYGLCKEGGVRSRLPWLIVCVVFFIAWIVVFIVLASRPAGKITGEKFGMPLKIWHTAAIILLATISIFYGIKTAGTAVNYNGKLSWFIEEIKNKRDVEFSENNIYESGIEGLFTQLDEKLDMPEELYIANSFELTFDASGSIKTVDAFVYGNGDDGELESFLISYDASNSAKVTVWLNGYTSGEFEDSMKMEPLFETMDAISPGAIVEEWVDAGEDSFGITYSGLRNWGYNTDGIVYVTSTGMWVNGEDTLPISEIVNYSVSFYISGYADGDTLNGVIYHPVRCILVENIGDIDNENAAGAEMQEKEEAEAEEGSERVLGEYIEQEDGSQEFYLDDTTGFRLSVADAAAGSRFYVLEATEDGQNWDIVNPDPFGGNTGVAAGLTFLNDDIGFICLGYSGGAYGEIYMTSDGGTTFTLCTLDTGGNSAFDFPRMPYEEKETYFMDVGQGSDGDYNGGVSAKFASKDGVIWSFMTEN